MSEKFILGIETSCDDTSLCILRGPANCPPTEVLTHQTFSQNLQKWGGVVPEIAARNHIQKLSPLFFESLKEAQLKIEQIDAIAVTTHPGLLGPLLTGLSFAKTITLAKKKPIIPVNHLFAHLEAIHIDQEMSYPYIGLLVSGGHSLFCKVHSAESLEIISSTIDDAAGEAFDKGGKILGLPYPAGRIIDDLAKEGDAQKHNFPIGLRNSKDGKMSFSGLKTSLKQFVDQNQQLLDHNQKDFTQEFKDVCASYQKAIVDSLSLKAKEVYQLISAEDKDRPLVVGGGVACNSALRNALTSQFNSFFVTPKYCTDNGAMVANYGLLQFDKAVSYPQCLELEAQNRFISKSPQK